MGENGDDDEREGRLVRWGWIYVLLAVVFVAGLLAGSAKRPARRRWPSESRVAEIMSRPPVTISEDTTVEEAARMMLDQGIGCTLVVDARGELAGILTESDFTGRQRIVLSRLAAPEVLGEWVSEDKGIEDIYQAVRGRPVRDVMTPSVVTASPDDSVTEIVLQMIERDLHRIPVVEERVPVGVVTRRDLLRIVAPDAAP